MAATSIALQKPFPFTDQHPMFRIRGWNELLGKREVMAAAEMVRHFLATGETGSGKSLSAVMRLLEAILRYPESDLYEEYRAIAGDAAESLDNLRPAVFVIDPKQELGELVDREARGRRVTRITYGEKGPVLHLFEGKDLNKLDAAEAVEFILLQSDFFVRDQANTREPSWNMQAAAVLKDFIAVDMLLAKRGIDQVRELWGKVSVAISRYEDLKAATPSIAYDPCNYFKAMSTLLSISSSEHVSIALSCYVDACNEMTVPGELIVRFMALSSMYHSTRCGVLWMADGILADIASDELATCVSLNPIEAPPAEKLISVKQVLDAGDVVVYIPTSGVSSIAETVGRCLKSKFFEFAFERANKVRPFFYVVDEAHRFISAGEQDGEQSLLDRCRAFRTGVVLSTQSIASMAHKLQGAMDGGRNALDIMLNNCGNALYFRTSDIRTQENLRERIPRCPRADGLHVISVRPLTTLPVGSCYATRCNGKWGLFQVRLP